ALADGNPEAADAVIRGLARGWPSGKPPALDASFDQSIEQLMMRLPAERRGVLLKLAGAWGSKKLEAQAAEVARTLIVRMNTIDLKSEDRLAAARELLGLKADKATVVAVLDLVTPDASPDLAGGLLEALRGAEAPEAGRLILDRLPGFTPALRVTAFSIL